MNSFIKGILFVSLIWIMNTFIAFGIFGPESNTQLVISSWVIALILLSLYLIKIKYLNRMAIISSIGVVIILIFLYNIPVNDNLPTDASELNKEISNRNIDRYGYALELFLEVEKKWTGPTRQYLLEPQKVFFIKDASFFWNLEDGSYVPSNIQADIYRNLLIQERFDEEEIEFRTDFCSNSPHGFIKIDHPTQEIFADLWAVDNFEEYKFGQFSPPPCDELTGEEFK